VDAATVPDMPAMTIDARRRLGVLAIARAVMLVDAKYAFDATDHAADGTADHGTDGASAAIAFIDPMRNATGNALRLRHQRRRESQNSGCDRNFDFHDCSTLLNEPTEAALCRPMMA